MKPFIMSYIILSFSIYDCESTDETQRMFLSLFTVFIPSISDAKIATFTWQNELCEFEGQYKPAIFS